MKHSVRAVLYIACGFAALPGFALAAEAPGSGEAVIVDHSDLTVSETDATTEGGGSATANALTVDGQPPAEQTGGTQTGEGSSSGNTADTGDEAPANAAVTPWEASVDSSGDCSTANGDAAAARAGADEVGTVDVVQSSSGAEECADGSSGTASNDVAAANLGDGALTVTALHSEHSSDGGGGAYLLGLNDNELFTNEQANGQCAAGDPEVVTIGCLFAGGGGGSGPGDSSGETGMASASAGDGAFSAGFGTTGAAGGPGGDDGGTGGGGGAGFGSPDDGDGGGSGGGGSFGSPDDGGSGGPDDSGAGAPDGSTLEAAGAPGPSSPFGGNLPRTGGNAWPQFVMALGLISLGSVMLGTRRALILLHTR